MPAARRRLFVAAQWLLAAAIIWYAVRALRGQWLASAARLSSLEIDWTILALATAVVVATYLMLVEAWRRIIIASGSSLAFSTATRIWFASNLGKYVPGKVWSIAAMSVMARQSGVSPIAAAGSSILMQLVTVAAGIGIVFATGVQAIDRPAIAVVAAFGIGALLVATPFILPAVARLAAKLIGREVVVPRLAVSTMWLATLTAAASWIAYGIAFQLFARAVLGSAAGATSSYIAVYAASYILGFLALFAPGGAIVREGAMITGMLRFGLSSEADALAVAVASRLWLTATELLPGLVYLALGKRADTTP